MGARVSSIPNDEFSQGGAGTVEKYHRLANSCTRISEAYSEKKKKKHKCVCLAERRLPVLTAVAAARFGCQPEPCRKIFPSAKM